MEVAGRWESLSALEVGRSCFSAAVQTGMLFGAFAGCLELVGIARNGDDRGVMDEMVDQRKHASGVGDDLPRLIERAVGDDQCATDLVHGVLGVQVAHGADPLPALANSQLVASPVSPAAAVRHYP